MCIFQEETYCLLKKPNRLVDCSFSSHIYESVSNKMMYGIYATECQYNNIFTS